MKHVCCILLLAVAAVLSTGCDSAQMSQPLPPETQPVEREKFEGTWKADNQTIAVRYADDGVLHFASLEWKDGEFTLNRGRVFVTKGPAHNYLSLESKDEDSGQMEYFFLRYAFTSDDDLLVWAPRVPAFAAAVEEGALEGTVSRGDYTTSVTITTPPEDMLAFLEEGDHSSLFNLDEPGVVIKVAPAK